MFFVVDFSLRKDLKQRYSSSKIKYIVENRFFSKSPYNYVTVILTHKPVADSIDGIKETIFKLSSFTKQKYGVSLLQQGLANVLNEYLLEWSIEIFKKGFGLEKATDTYRRHLILQCESGSTGKSMIARLLAFRLNFRNYINLESFPTEKRRNSIMYFFLGLNGK